VVPVHVAGVYSLERLHYGAFPTKNTTNNMKTIRITTLIAVALLTAGTALAQGGPNRRGKGYGGPPQTEAERAARQEQGQKANGGTCDGQGQGQGQGKRLRRGPRDGSGPRGGGGNCPAGN